MSYHRQRSFLLLAGAAAAAGILAVGYQTWHGSRKRALFRQVQISRCSPAPIAAYADPWSKILWRCAVEASDAARR